jgi:NADPH2:quinone reductase
MAQAIMLREHGGPEVLRLEEVEVGDPPPGMVRVEQTAIGVNFHDCYVRSGLYDTLKLPGIPGLEAVGRVTATGQGVTNILVGERCAYFTAGYGAYASERLVHEDLVLRIPDSVDDRIVAAVLLKGLTASMLIHQVHEVGPGDTILVHAAAGGVGLLLSQWAQHQGATVIGTAGGPAKVALAMAAGCDEAIDYKSEDFVARVRDITEGKGVTVAYDSVGKDTFYGSMECLADRGHLVNFGQSSGPIDPMPVSMLSKGSYTLSRPMLFHYTSSRHHLVEMAEGLFQTLSSKVLRMDSPRAWPLADAAAAHRALEARETMGAVILTV